MSAISQHINAIQQKLHVENFLETDDAALDAAIVRFQEEQNTVHVS